MHADGANLYDYHRVASQAHTKFKFDNDRIRHISKTIVAIHSKAEDAGQDPNSVANCEAVINLLRNELSDYIEFKEWSEDAQKWVVV